MREDGSVKNIKELCELNASITTLDYDHNTLVLMVDRERNLVYTLGGFHELMSGEWEYYKTEAQ